MKKLLSLLMVLLTISACSKSEEQSPKPTPAPTASIDKDTIFSFDINTLSVGCDNNSEMVCAINASIKCTINPDFAECAELKAFMPNFIFMQKTNYHQKSLVLFLIRTPIYKIKKRDPS